MHRDVHTLLDQINGLKSSAQLSMVQMHADTIALYYGFARDRDAKTEYREILQQLTDLFVHIYNKQPLMNFNSVTRDESHLDNTEKRVIL